MPNPSMRDQSAVMHPPPMGPISQMVQPSPSMRLQAFETAERKNKVGELIRCLRDEFDLLLQNDFMATARSTQETVAVTGHFGSQLPHGWSHEMEKVGELIRLLCDEFEYVLQSTSTVTGQEDRQISGGLSEASTDHSLQSADKKESTRLIGSGQSLPSLPTTLESQSAEDPQGAIAASLASEAWVDRQGGPTDAPPRKRLGKARRALSKNLSKAKSVLTRSLSFKVRLQHVMTRSEYVMMRFYHHRRLIFLVVSIVTYIILAVLMYTHLEDWDVLECIYFAFVVATTVGYGDYLPSSDRSKVATTFFVLFASAIVVVAIETCIRYVHRTAMKYIAIDEKRLGIFSDEKVFRRKMQRLLRYCMAFALVLATGTAVFATWIDWPEGSGDKWINGLYLTVITVTTIGFGDYSPANSDSHWLKVFGCFLMLVGIPVSATFFSVVSHIIFGQANEDVVLRLLHGTLSKGKHSRLVDFAKALRAEGMSIQECDDEFSVSRFEYFVFVLVKNSVLDLRNIKDVMMNFDAADVTHTGTLAMDDCTRVSSREELDIPRIRTGLVLRE